MGAALPLVLLKHARLYDGLEHQGQGAAERDLQPGQEGCALVVSRQLARGQHGG